MKNIVLVFLFLFCTSKLSSQKNEFTKQDTLRGSITPERIWWDLQYYHLDISVNPTDSSIQGSNLIQYKVLNENQLMQIDLQTPMLITKVIQDNNDIKFIRDGNVYYLELQKKQKLDSKEKIKIFYEGKPKVSKYPPWDGGITWTKDSLGNNFIASTCQGDGASLWWPCKDHMYDEPDSMLISVTVPNPLFNVSNGRLRKVLQNENGTNTSFWFVSNPINNYGVNINVGDYVNFSEIYNGEKGDLDCDYYVLSYNLEKAKKQFKDVPRMLAAFEYWFGPYPFYEDSYKLVEAPYLGMEHQSSVTYGNGYKNGFRGKDPSNSGWGMKFDHLIIHESGHEWFANSITYKDIADMWIHESFTNYSESLYLDYHYGTEAANEYVIGIRHRIRNQTPIIGVYNVNKSGSGDMYHKGGNMLHTLRQMINDDNKWRLILRKMNSEFYHQTVTTEQIENFLINETGFNLQPFFDQYLRDIRIPNFEYTLVENKLSYRWTNTNNEFSIPLKIFVDNKEMWITPTSHVQKLNFENTPKSITVDENFYISINN